ncbi:MAG: sigma-70 family RNA polymerase sigma factor [Chthoniobacterales bacterium]|nr:sigma-70 family RNA polymerase sigma factor [Chthoniobacterales bacterium]
MNLGSVEVNAAADAFTSTRWSVVRAAGASGISSVRALDALSELCQIYWRPLYLFLRRGGVTPEDAQDLTQGFFAELIRDRTYFRADRQKGRFRSFLIGALKHFVADARDHERAQKRGGGKLCEPLDEATVWEAERQVARNQRWEAQRVYDREWAEALLRQSLDRLAQECAFAGKAALFEALRSHLSLGMEEAVPYDQLAIKVRRPAATLRKNVERLRARYGDILREEVRGTVFDPAEVDEELRYLCQALNSGT